MVQALAQADEAHRSENLMHELLEKGPIQPHSLEGSKI